MGFHDVILHRILEQFIQNISLFQPSFFLLDLLELNDAVQDFLFQSRRYRNIQVILVKLDMRRTSSFHDYFDFFDYYLSIFYFIYCIDYP